MKKLIEQNKLSTLLWGFILTLPGLIKAIGLILFIALIIGCDGADRTDCVDGENAIAEQEKVFAIEIFGDEIKEYQKDYLPGDYYYNKYPVNINRSIEKITQVRIYIWHKSQQTNYIPNESLGSYLYLMGGKYHIYIPFLKCNFYTNSNCSEGMPGMTDCILYNTNYYCTDASADAHIRLNIYYN